MQLEGKRALITGAGSGIGRALAIEASCRGISVALCGRRSEALAETLGQMQPGQHLRIRGDITSADVRRNMRDYLWRKWGRLDILVNNAGLVPVGPFACVSDLELERMLATNVLAPMALTREMLPLLRRAIPSRVVNVGSMFGDIPYPFFAAYSASKFALRGLSVALRRELKLYGVGVTYAAPRATRTDAAKAIEPLMGPLKIQLDEPTPVARGIWRGVEKDADSVYARGPERLYVLLQRLLPRLIDRTVAAQMADKRVRIYLAQCHKARTSEGGEIGSSTTAQETRPSALLPMAAAEPA